jgi:hypothetical protein
MSYGSAAYTARRRRGYGGGGAPSGAPGVPVQVTVTPASATPNANQTQLYTAVTRDAMGSVIGGRTYTWDTSDHSKATIVNNNNGTATVTALAADSSAVTVTATDVAAVLNGTATVGPIAIATVAVTPASATIALAGTQLYTGTPKDANAVTLTGRGAVTWAISDPTIATIVDNLNGTATVTAVAGGTVTVTATCETIQGTATTTVGADVLRYLVGGATGGFGFARAGVATYRNVSNVLASAATGVIRDAHYFNGERVLLLELAIANQLLRSEALDNASWTKTGSTVTADATTAPDGNATMDLVKEDSSTGQHGVQQAPATQPGNVESAVSCFFKPKERTACQITTTDRGGATLTSIFDTGTGTWTVMNHARSYVEPGAYSNGAWRIGVTVQNGASGTSAKAFFGLANGTGSGADSYTGDGASGGYIWGCQWENHSTTYRGFPTSYIVTTTAAVTRVGDALTFVPPTPAALTFYLDFYDLTEVSPAGNNVRFWRIGSSESTADAFYGRTAGSLTCTHYNGAALASGNVTLASVVKNDRVELRGTMFANGSCRCAVSRNAAAESVSTTSSTGAIGASWNGNTMTIMGIGNVATSVAVRSIKWQSGAEQTIPQMRAL